MATKKFDYLIVGAGLYGSVFAYEAKKRGMKCLVIDRRNHVGGNLFCENIAGINVHKYGPHIFHTDNKKIWDYVNSFVEFNRFTYSPLANYKGKLYNLPFNMNTFYQLWSVKTPDEAKKKIEEQTFPFRETEPTNLEEQALKMVGPDIYEKLIKGYTEKQWGRNSSEIPAFIIKRIPLRFIYDNNYFNDRYQGIPIGGYNVLFNLLLKNIDVKLGVDYKTEKKVLSELADKIVYTGALDELFDYCFGSLDYRSLSFETEVLNQSNFQGNAGVNYTERTVPYTRIIEHKHFEFGNQPDTVITREYSVDWSEGMEPYYPINDDDNNNRYRKYKDLADNIPKLILGGRLAEYKYYDMHNIIEKVLTHFEKE